MTRMVPASGPMIMLSFGLSRGLDMDELCGAIGFSPSQLTDPMRMVPFETSLRLWRLLIARLPEENVGIGLASIIRIEHFGLLWAFLKHLPNALEALKAFAHFSPLSDTACESEPITVATAGEQVEVRWPASLKYGIPERVETLNGAILRTFTDLLGAPLIPSLVRAAHPVDSKRRIAEQFYRCVVAYDSADDALCFDRATLLRPMRNANPEAAEALRALVERKLAPDPRLPFGQRVRRIVEIQLRRGELRQSEVASALGLSVRSLQRGLSDEGLRYADLVGDALKSVATTMMLDQARSLDEIAAALGYSEASSFARTWRRLTGESPARYRARLRGRKPESVRGTG